MTSSHPVPALLLIALHGSAIATLLQGHIFCPCFESAENAQQFEEYGTAYLLARIHLPRNMRCARLQEAEPGIPVTLVIIVVVGIPGQVTSSKSNFSGCSLPHGHTLQPGQHV